MAKKITITIPDDIYVKLEADRGLVPRATYIQSLIGGTGGDISSSFSLDSGNIVDAFLPDGYGGTDGDVSSFDVAVDALEARIGSFDVDYMDGTIQKELIGECRRIRDEYGWGFNERGGYFFNSEGVKRVVKGLI